MVDTERRQVFELPEIRLVVTEDIAERRRCRCGCTTKATFADVATAPACYGPGIRDLAAYLAAHQDLPFDRMAQLFSDVLGAPVSVGTRAQMVTEAAATTKPFLDATRNLLHEAPVVHFDETGGRAVRRLHWVRSASTSLLTLVDCHPKAWASGQQSVRATAKTAAPNLYPTNYPTTRDLVPSGCFRCIRSELVRLPVPSSWGPSFPALFRTHRA